MVRHIFLTGEKQIGKSTAVEQVVRRWPGHVDGFLTRSRLEDGWRRVYVCSPDGAHRRLAARFGPGQPRQLRDPGAFGELGAALLKDSGRQPGALTLMDEIGFLECGVEPFVRAVLERLDREGPVLGVLRKDDNPLLWAVAEHPAVKVVEVTRDNRDQLPDLILEWLLRGGDGQSAAGR